MGTITIGRRRSGAACPQGGRRRHGGATLPQARARAAPPCSAPGADWGGLAPPPYRRRGPSGRSCSATGAPVLGAGPGRGVLLPPSLLPSCVLLSGYAAPARRPPPGSGQGGDCWIMNKAWLPCWKAALLWDSKWEVDVDGVGAVA